MRKGNHDAVRPWPWIAALVALGGATPAVAQVVANWQLDESAGTIGAGSVIDSVGGFNGTPTGGVTFGGPGATTSTGTSATFNGAGSIDVPHNAAVNPTSFTVTAWANIAPSSSGFRSVVTSRNGFSNGREGYILYAGGNNNHMQFWTGDGNNNWDVLTGPPQTDGAWNHYALSFDAGTNTKSLYVNGQLAATTNGQQYIPNTVHPLHIGGGAETGTQFRFSGGIDDVQVHSGALSQSQIQQVMTGSGEPATNLSLGKTYSYSVLPTFSGGTFYLDDAHVQTAGVFDAGDLTDGVIHNTTPTVPTQNTIVGWGDPVNIATEIIFDLEEVYAIDNIQIGTETWAPFANGAPDDVVVSFSDTGINPGDFSDAIAAAFDAPLGDGHHDLFVAGLGTEAQYVKLSFDGGAVLSGNTPNKWMLDEVSIFGRSVAPVPEPASIAIWSLISLGLAGFGYRRIRRKK